MIYHSYRAVYQSHIEVEKGQWNAIHVRLRLLEQRNKELEAELKTYKDAKSDATGTLAGPVGNQQQPVQADDTATGTTKPRVKRAVKDTPGQ